MNFKKIIFLTFLFLLNFFFFANSHYLHGNDCFFSKEEKVDIENINSDCTYKGFELYGRIQFVNAFPDIKVQIVNSFPDLRVRIVDAFPDACGEWQVVEEFPDLKVQIVNAFPDIRIHYVDAFPGLVD